LIPSDITLSKVITIQAKKDSIFHLLMDQQQWYRWHPVFKDGANNAAFQSIKAITLNETDSTLTMQWQQNNKKPLGMNWALFTEKNDLATLQWSMHFHQSWYPWQKFGSLFYESNYGKMMEQGLANLKQALE
jgi:hypothetical protein